MIASAISAARGASARPVEYAPCCRLRVARGRGHERGRIPVAIHSVFAPLFAPSPNARSAHGVEMALSRHFACGPGRDRTCDLGIKSPLLYRLSYRPAGIESLQEQRTIEVRPHRLAAQVTALSRP